MDFHEEKRKEKDSSISISLPKNNLALTLPSPPMYRLINTTNNPTSLEIRLFYVRISPCATTNLPDHLKILHLRREIGVSLEINGSRIPASDTATLTLRRDRIDKETSEVTYVSTDNLRVTGVIEFEVYEEAEMVLCGTLERVDSVWSNGNADKDSKTGWSMDCYTGAGVTTGSCSFFQPKLGISWPSIEVYVAGCCSGVPLILTKTIQVSPRRKHVRHGVLDAIPEDDENGGGNELVRQRRTTSQVSDTDVDEYDSEGKIVPAFYPGEMYTDEDGQLTWFNAGVRVGVGIGLGMCLGIGIGVGLLMRSYQATTRTFRRRFT